MKKFSAEAENFQFKRVLPLEVQFFSLCGAQTRVDP